MRWFGKLLLDTALVIPRALTGRRPWLVVPVLTPIALFSLIVVVLATANEVRVILLYWLTDRDSVGPNTWGGPTMAGAWAVHAALGVALLPVFAVVLAGMRALTDRAARRLRGERRQWWILPATAVMDVVAVIFVVAFAIQL